MFINFKKLIVLIEIDTLKEQGYSSGLAGDFNAHVRNDSRGIPDNNRDINWNGKHIRHFIQTNNLSIVNRNQDRCQGLFIRITANSMSILDLVLEDNSTDKVMDLLVIDKYGDVLVRSYHAALLFNIRYPKDSNCRMLHIKRSI